MTQLHPTDLLVVHAFVDRVGLHATATVLGISYPTLRKLLTRNGACLPKTHARIHECVANIKRREKEYMAAIRHREMTDGDDIRETPLELFAQLDERFHFTLDAAALPSNALCPRFYGSGSPLGECGIRGSWKDERVFCNPPFSTIDEWVRKAWASEAELVCMICPVTRTGRAWWHELIEPYRDGRGRSSHVLELTTEFLQGRVQYTVNGGEPIRSKTKTLKNGKGQKLGCMFDSMLLIWQTK